jgi:polyisoprenoid-binding protein YceI
MGQEVCPMWEWIGIWLLLGLVPADTTSYRVVPEESRMTVHVGTAGLFKMFGHEHQIDVRKLSGQVDWDPEAPQSSRFRLEVEAASLTVADEELSEEDRAQVQADMESKALAVAENPRILFESTEVRVEKPGQLKLRGNLDLRGVKKPLEVPVMLEVSEGRITAKGKMELESGNWGVPQISAVGGSVKTSQDLAIDFEIVAVR